MAAWQFDLHFIPKGLSLPEVDSEGTFDDSFWWAQQQPRCSLDRLFGEILPPTPSWSSDLTQFGKEDETCIQVWRGNGEVSSIKARIDLRSVSIDIIENIVAAALLLQCRLYLPEGHGVIEPEVDLLVSELRQSDAAAFVENPKGFLMKLHVKNKDN